MDHAVVLRFGLPVARARLAYLTSGCWLRDACDQAYTDGLAGLARVGPFGDVPGAAKLVRVLMLEPVERDGVITLPLRWEATGIMGRMFPVLDANVTLSGLGGDKTELALHGVYRPPLAVVGESLDRALLHHAAHASVRSLVKRMATAMTVPAQAPVNERGCMAAEQPGAQHRMGGFIRPALGVEPD